MWLPLMLVHGRTHAMPPFIHLDAAPLAGPLCPAAAAPDAAAAAAAMQKPLLQVARLKTHVDSAPPSWLPELSQVCAAFPSTFALELLGCVLNQTLVADLNLAPTGGGAPSRPVGGRGARHAVAYVGTGDVSAGGCTERRAGAGHGRHVARGGGGA